MNETTYEFVVVVLVAVVVALVAAQALLSRKSVDASKEQYPPDTLDKLLMLLNLGAGLAGKTATKMDDEGLKVAAAALGLTWEIDANGVLLFKKAPPAAG